MCVKNIIVFLLENPEKIALKNIDLEHAFLRNGRMEGMKFCTHDFEIIHEGLNF